MGSAITALGFFLPMLQTKPNPNLTEIKSNPSQTNAVGMQVRVAKDPTTDVVNQRLRADSVAQQVASMSDAIELTFVDIEQVRKLPI